MPPESRPNRRFIDVQVGTRVALRRMERKITRADAATALGITEAELSNKELGRARFEPAEIVNLATLLDTTPGWFFEGMGVTVRDMPFED